MKKCYISSKVDSLGHVFFIRLLHDKRTKFSNVIREKPRPAMQASFRAPLGFPNFSDEVSCLHTFILSLSTLYSFFPTFQHVGLLIIPLREERTKATWKRFCDYSNWILTGAGLGRCTCMRKVQGCAFWIVPAVSIRLCSLSSQHTVWQTALEICFYYITIDSK